MKKKNLLFYIVIVLSVMGVFMEVNASNGTMQTLPLKKITSYSRPKNYTSSQGEIVTDKYVITIFTDNKHESTSKNGLLVLNKGNFKKASLKSNPMKKYVFGHGNDGTCNAKTNKVIILNHDKIFFLNGNDLTLENTKKFNKSFHGIGYDSESDQYVLAQNVSGGSKVYVMDSNFNEKSSFTVKSSLAKQGLTVHNGLVYLTYYHSGKTTKYREIFGGKLKSKENVIYVYDLKGNKKNIFYIPQSYKGEKFNELEDIGFDGSKMILQFHQKNKVAYYTPIYDNEVDADITMKLDNQNYSTKDNSFVVKVYENGKVIDTLKNKNNTFLFSKKYTTKGVYHYQVKQESTGNSDVLYDVTTKDLEVKVYYDPSFNKMVATSNDITFTNLVKVDSPSVEKIDSPIKETDVVSSDDIEEIAADNESSVDLTNEEKGTTSKEESTSGSTKVIVTTAEEQEIVRTIGGENNRKSTTTNNNTNNENQQATVNTNSNDKVSSDSSKNNTDNEIVEKDDTNNKKKDDTNNKKNETKSSKKQKDTIIDDSIKKSLNIPGIQYFIIISIICFVLLGVVIYRKRNRNYSE